MLFHRKTGLSEIFWPGFYIPVVSTDNANAVNEALTIEPMCAVIQKYARP